MEARKRERERRDVPFSLQILKSKFDKRKRLSLYPFYSLVYQSVNGASTREENVTHSTLSTHRPIHDVLDWMCVHIALTSLSNKLIKFCVSIISDF